MANLDPHLLSTADNHHDARSCGHCRGHPCMMKTLDTSGCKKRGLLTCCSAHRKLLSEVNGQNLVTAIKRNGIIDGPSKNPSSANWWHGLQFLSHAVTGIKPAISSRHNWTSKALLVKWKSRATVNTKPCVAIGKAINTFWICFWEHDDHWGSSRHCNSKRNHRLSSTASATNEH